jgi:hypothetical protein
MVEQRRKALQFTVMSRTGNASAFRLYFP